MNLADAFKNFASKISGTSVVDNANNPGSAYSIRNRKIADYQKNKKTVSNSTPYMPNTYGTKAKQKTYGVPGAK